MAIGGAVLVVGLVGLLLPVSAFDGGVSTVACGNALAANQSPLVAACDSAISGRRHWAIPLVIVGAAGILAGIAVRGRKIRTIANEGNHDEALSSWTDIDCLDVWRLGATGPGSGVAEADTRRSVPVVPGSAPPSRSTGTRTSATRGGRSDTARATSRDRHRRRRHATRRYVGGRRSTSICPTAQSSAVPVPQ